MSQQKVICSDCQQLKPCKARGLCEACYTKQRRTANPERAREIYKRANIKRKEWQRAYNKQYREAHKEDIYAYIKNYVAENRARVNAYGRAWCQRNPVKCRARHKNWKNKNRERWLNYQATYQRARAVNLKIKSVEVIDRLQVYERDQGICGICKESVSRSDFTIDHIIPLSKDGIHAYSNVQTAHSLCNSKKGAKIC